MGLSTTVIAALKYRGGVVITADSQASDPYAEVRWPCEKLDCVQAFPLVIGFSGDESMAQEARENLLQARFHANTFDKKTRVKDFLDRILDPTYQNIEHKLEQRKKLQQNSMFWDITIWGLAAFWAEDEPHILELEAKGVCTFHECFHAIGSGSKTAYAIWRTLGGKRLLDLSWPKSLHAMLRILMTCVGVEWMGVSEPLSVWNITGGVVKKLKPDEINAEMQLVSEWEEKEHKAFFETKPLA